MPKLIITVARAWSMSFALPRDAPRDRATHEAVARSVAGLTLAVSRRSDRPRPRQQTLIEKFDHSPVDFAASALGTRSMKNVSRQIR